MDTEAELVEQVEQKTAKDNSNKYFVVGIFSGVLITLIVIGAVFLFKSVYQKQSIRKAINTVQGNENTKITGNDELVTPKLVKKIGVLEGMIDKYYYDEYTTEALENGVYHGIIDSLGDKYARYYSVEEVKQLQQDSGGYYCGIGAYVSYDEEKEICVIAGTMEGTPAESVGLREGDIIYKVDGVETQGMPSSDVVALIKGEEGTIVHISIIREGLDDILEIDIERAKVETSSVSYEMLDDNIGYIGISEFDTNTSDQFTEALAILKDQGARGFIFDLRSNLGGNLDTCCEMCREILPEGMIVYTMDKYGNKKEYTCDGSNELKLPLVVITNAYSASASEIMTGAVKDHGVGTVIGTTTYGKGVVQKVIPLTDGSALKITTSKYFTPSGVCIHGTGIVPDIEVTFDAEAYYNDGIDNQLNAAIEEIHRKWETAE